MENGIAEETMSEKVGFLGLGTMGLGMARTLLEKGFELRVWNRTAEKADSLVERGATAVARPEEAIEPGGIVVSMLSDDRVVSELFAPAGPVLRRLGASGLHISMSTIHPDTSRRLAREHAEAGASYLTAPVFGRPQTAVGGNLWILVSGPEAARKRAKPLFEAMGRKTFEFGDEPGAANVPKLCGNFLIASAIEAMGEVAAFAEKSGVGARPVLEMLTQSLFACAPFQGYGQHIAERRFLPAGFRLVLGLKDIELAISAARSAGVPMPLGGLLRDRALASVNKGRGEWEWSAMTLEAAEDAGLDVTEVNRTE
jgi:3-hydroxyisobutyrate dehydrogenase-like beta-hydroxyacid dehydrogenase